MTLWKPPLSLAYPCHAKEARVPTDHEGFRSDTLARRRATTDAKDLLFRLLERKDESALPDAYRESRVVRATDEPVVPCELLLESGSYSHGLRHQVLVNPFHICGAEEAHVMHVWMSRIGRLRLTIPLYTLVLWRTRPRHVPGLEKRRRAAPSTRKEQDTFLKHAVVQQGKLNTSPRLGSLHEVRANTDHERKSIGHVRGREQIILCRSNRHWFSGNDRSQKDSEW